MKSTPKKIVPEQTIFLGGGGSPPPSPLFSRIKEIMSPMVNSAKKIAKLISEGYFGKLSQENSGREQRLFSADRRMNSRCL